MKQIIFIHLPKTAGTFLSRYVRKVKKSSIIYLGHLALTDFMLKNKLNNLDNYFVFGFVRNPWEWYISRYFWFCKKSVEEQGISKACDAGLSGDDFKQQTFREHILYGLNNPLVNNSFWLTNRYKEMFYYDNKLALDHVGKTETIYDDINYVLSVNGVKSKWKKYWNKNKHNKNKATNHNHYSHYYTDDLIDIIKEKDQEIIKQYNYKFERQ